MVLVAWHAAMLALMLESASAFDAPSLFGQARRSRAHSAMTAPVGAEMAVITCGRCKASYEVEAAAIGEGQYVKCTNCDHQWFQSVDRLHSTPEGMELVDYPAEMKSRLDAGLTALPSVGFRAFVGNLAFTVSDAQLRELFEEYGSVVSVSVMLGDDGRPRGFGFVNMESAEAGAAAVAALDGFELNGRRLNVTEGKQGAGGRGRGDGRGRGGRGRGRGARGGGRGDFRGRG